LIDKPLTEGNFFKAGNLEALAGFEGTDKVTCLEQTFMSTGVEPGNPTSELFNPQLAPSQIL